MMVNTSRLNVSNLNASVGSGPVELCSSASQASVSHGMKPGRVVFANLALSAFLLYRFGDHDEALVGHTVFALFMVQAYSVARFVLGGGLL